MDEKTAFKFLCLRKVDILSMTSLTCLLQYKKIKSKLRNTQAVLDVRGILISYIHTVK